MSENSAGSSNERLVIAAGDGHRIAACYRAPAETRPRALLQILHGLAEHAARYERFAAHCVGRGLAVVSHDHRGHGESCDSDTLGHFAERDGWQQVLDDVGSVQRAARERAGDVPVALFGHSMGSYIAQACAMRAPESIDALLLSGSTSASRLTLWLGRLAAGVEAWLRGQRFASPSLNAQAFGAFNKRFEPARTDFDWLSRDGAEVDRYVADPLCGFLPTARLWQDLLGGMLDIGRERSLRRIPAGLPILITGGSEDPVGGREGMQRLAERYRATGHERVTLEVFDGARHEMLNETNRDEFEEFLIGWLEEALELPPAGSGD